MREEVRWTNLTKTEIAERLAKTSTPVSVNIVTQLLDDAGLSPPQAAEDAGHGKRSPPQRSV